MSEDEIDTMLREPAPSLQLVRMEAVAPKPGRRVFAFLCRFPTSIRYPHPRNLCFTVSADYPENAFIHPDSWKQFVLRVIERVKQSNDAELLNFTNWDSAGAAIQRIITEYNEIVARETPRGMRAN